MLRKRDDIPCTTVTDAKDLLQEIRRFQEEELAEKEKDKNNVRPKFANVKEMVGKSLGKFEIPDGYEPEKVEAAWAELIRANDEREAALCAEYRRYLNLLYISI